MKNTRVSARWVGCALVFALAVAPASSAWAGKPIIASGVGTGVYYPSKGMFTAVGTNTEFGETVSSGRVESEATDDPLQLLWQNFGRGTKNEVLERVIFEDGTIYVRPTQQGLVQLVPLTDGSGKFTAQWTASEEIVKGTGRFKGAKGKITIVATNEPFLLTDTEWPFSWTWEGEIRLAGRGRDRDRDGDDD